ncbi:MAG: hypothetical protein CMJ78_00160 [Planctomycetaceae bacterium]|nr:hypothetical protein [Planctomycetaceae bacterium]
MSVWHLVLNEIKHRKLNFFLAALSVTVAVGTLVGAMTLLRADEIQTQSILDDKKRQLEKTVAKHEQETAEAGKKLEDDYRKITKGLGFNILILPEEQDLNEMYVDGDLSKSMPEQLVTKLAESGIVTVNHLLPIVTRKIEWPEINRSVILTGTRGEVPLAHRDPKKPLQDLIPAGTMHVGFALHTKMKWKKGDKVTLLGKEFEVTNLKPEQGDTDDGTIWINLAEAQELLKMQNLVNAILALECNCATIDRIGEIREDIEEILPGTYVVEKGSSALARAEARMRAKKSAQDSLKKAKADGEAAIAQEKTSRLEIRKQRENLAALLVPLNLIGCAIWIGFLTFGNVRNRASEIGILRAIGLRSQQILSLFLSKSLIIGIAGGGIGYAIGLFIGVVCGDLPDVNTATSQLFSINLVLASLVLAPVLASISSWLPALMAARQDPALVLQEA